MYILCLADDICEKFPLCEQICENTKESYVCKCHPGYKLNDNMVTCTPLTTENVNSSKLELFPFLNMSNISNNATKNESIAQTFANNIDFNEDEDSDVDPDDEFEDDLEETLVKETICPTGFKVDPLRLQRCIDINECLLNLHDCKSNQICFNTNGAFHCVNNCKSGLELNKETLKCEGEYFLFRI